MKKFILKDKTGQPISETKTIKETLLHIHGLEFSSRVGGCNTYSLNRATLRVEFLRLHGSYFYLSKPNEDDYTYILEVTNWD